MSIHSKNRHYLAFHISEIDQLQSTRMSQRIRTSSFTFTKFINILLRVIFAFDSKSSLLHNANESDSNAEFYIDDIFDEFEI